MSTWPATVSECKVKFLLERVTLLSFNKVSSTQYPVNNCFLKNKMKFNAMMPTSTTTKTLLKMPLNIITWIDAHLVRRRCVERREERAASGKLGQDHS